MTISHTAEYALRAIAMVRKGGYDVDFKVAGDGPLRTRLEETAAALGIKGAVSFLGWQTQQQVKELLGAADIMLVPSVTASNGSTEGHTVVSMEAMASGVPVVATRHAGIPELVKDGKTGLLVEERDVDGLAEKMRLLIEDPGLRETLARNGRKKIEEQFDIDKLNDRLVGIFQDLLQGRLPSDQPSK